MSEAVFRFGVQSRVSNAAVLYYSGHGMQYDGTNYIIPVDADIILSAVQIEDNAISADVLARATKSAENIGVLILDACRDNPIVNAIRKDFMRSKASFVHDGLAEMRAADYFLISYATDAGKTAADGSAPNELSPYARALSEQLTNRDLTIRGIFDRVITSVCDLTAPTGLPGSPLTGDCQRPAVYTQMGVEPLFLYQRPDSPEKAINSPLMVDIRMADPSDPATDKMLGDDNNEFKFRYIWEPPASSASHARVIPDVDYFVSEDERGRPLIVAVDAGYYAPGEASTPWSLSYPILDLVARKISSDRPITIETLTIESRNSRLDGTPYISMIAPGTEVCLLTLINQSWQTIKEVELEFDVLGIRSMSDAEIRFWFDSRSKEKFKHTIKATNLVESKNVSFVSELRKVMPEIDFYVFAQGKNITVRDNGDLVIKAPDATRQSAPPPGFKEWYQTVYEELSEVDDTKLWVAGVARPTGVNGQMYELDFAAGLTVVLPGVGGGQVNFDLINFTMLPIDGKFHSIERKIGSKLTSQKQTFRGLFPLIAKKTSFHELRFTLRGHKQDILYQSPWADTHIVVSRNDKSALGKRWRTII
jgi:hypothetical protein